MPTLVQEPNQQHFIVDNTFRSNALDSSTIVAGVVSSPTGPCEEMVIKNVAELCDLYTNSDTITSDADTTLLHAAKILQFAPMHIVRAANANVKAGITNNGDIIYTDVNYVPYKYSKTYALKDDEKSMMKGYIGFTYLNEKNEVSSKTFYIDEDKYEDVEPDIIKVFGVDHADGVNMDLPEGSSSAIGIDPVFAGLKKTNFKNKLENVSIDYSNPDYHTIYTTGDANFSIFPGFDPSDSDEKWLKVSKSNIESNVWKFTTDESTSPVTPGTNFISLNNYSFYLGAATESVVIDAPGTGIEISIPVEENSEVSANLFALHVFDQICKDDRFKNPVMSKVDSTVSFKVKPYETEGTTTYLTILSNMDEFVDINVGGLEGEDIPSSDQANGTSSISFAKKYTLSSEVTVTIKSIVEDSTIVDDGRYFFINISTNPNTYKGGSDLVSEVKGDEDIIDIISGVSKEKYITSEGSNKYKVTGFNNIKKGDINPGEELTLNIYKAEKITKEVEDEETGKITYFTGFDYTREGTLVAKSTIVLSKTDVFSTWTGTSAVNGLSALIYEDSDGNISVDISNFPKDLTKGYKVELSGKYVEFASGEHENTFAYFYNLTAERSYNVCSTIASGSFTVPMMIHKLGVAMTSDLRSDEYKYNTTSAGEGTTATRIEAKDTGSETPLWNLGEVTFYGLKSYWRTFVSSAKPIKISEPEDKFVRCLVSKDKENFSSKKSKFVLKFDNIVFWNGEKGAYVPSNPEEDTYQLDASRDGMTFDEFVSAVREELPSFYSVLPTITKGNEITLFSNSPAFSPVVKFGKISGVSILNPEVEKDYEFELSSRFAVVAAFPSNSKIFGIKMTERDNETWDLNIRRKNTTASYNVSFTPGAVNGYGVGIYFDYVNENVIDYKAIELNPDADPVAINEEFAFGDEISTPEPGLTQRKNALSKLTLDTGYYYNFITELGYNNVSYDAYAATIAEELNSQYITSTPRDFLSEDDVIRYREATGIDSRNVSMFTPYFKDGTLGNYIVDLSPSTEFLRRFFSNKALFREFGPCFGPTCGETTITTKRSSSSGLLVDFNTREKREKMLTKQINPIKIDRGLGMTYFTDNWTMQKKDSYLSDFQNMYATNVIQHILDQFMKQYFAAANNKATRDNVITVLTKALNERLFANQAYTPISFEVICDESNNPDPVVADRKLIVDVKIIYNVAIKYIETYTRILPISEA